MDYKTKPTSRNDLRRYAVYFRKIFDVPLTGTFPVLNALERLPDIFENCGYIVVEDNMLPPQTMARCTPNDMGGFTIEIKHSVYRGAFEKLGKCAANGVDLRAAAYMYGCIKSEHKRAVYQKKRRIFTAW